MNFMKVLETIKKSPSFRYDAGRCSQFVRREDFCVIGSEENEIYLLILGTVLINDNKPRLNDVNMRSPLWLSVGRLGGYLVQKDVKLTIN